MPRNRIDNVGQRLLPAAAVPLRARRAPRQAELAVAVPFPLAHIASLGLVLRASRPGFPAAQSSIGAATRIACPHDSPPRGARGIHAGAQFALGRACPGTSTRVLQLSMVRSHCRGLAGHWQECSASPHRRTRAAAPSQRASRWAAAALGRIHRLDAHCASPAGDRATNIGDSCAQLRRAWRPRLVARGQGQRNGFDEACPREQRLQHRHRSR
mmetsp:Transcript_70401/g.195928  ORF Transcript_70401/g.195928 Transcript_70401/m.195928 type:complete len:213 (+) Transcript_70401:439-1077(+)